MHQLLSLLLEEEDCVGVIDFRDDNAYLTGHIRNSLHIPGLAGLTSRFSWLPPPKSSSNAGKKLLLICSKVDKEELQKSLERWNVVGLLYEDDDQEFWKEASDLNLIVAGLEDVPLLLFEPSPLIDMAVRVCEGFIKGDTATVLDLGCGAARDIACIVRRQSRLKWQATGLDNLNATVKRVKLLRHDMRLDSNIGSRIEDVVWAQATGGGTLQALQESPDSKSKGIPIPPSSRGSRGGGEGGGGAPTDETLRAFAAAHLLHPTFDLILLIRFLPRPLLINLPQLTHEGSVIAISHFTTIASEQDYPSPDASKRFEERDVVMLLQNWGPDWQLVDQVIHRAEDNRPIRSVLFQRIEGKTG